MDNDNKKNKLVNYIKADDVVGVVKIEKDGIKENSDEIKEVDDKLIGDDLDIVQAEKNAEENLPALGNKENNY